MSQHARLSASAAHRWMACAGSVAPGGASSRYAAQGTFAHDIAAKCLTDTSISPSDFLCKRATVDGHEVECDLEMIEAVRLYIEACDDDSQAGDLTWIEMRLINSLREIDKDLGGTADYVRYRPATKHLRVVDFKYGSGVFVEADGNPQLKIYALGALLVAQEEGLAVSDVTVTIVQPRFEGAQPVRDFHFKAVELLDFSRELQVAADLTRLPSPPLAAGEHCKFCPKARTCPELEKRQHALIAAEFGPVAAYDTAALGAALANVALVKEKIRALEEFAYAEATRGVEIPGFKLVEKRPTRQWKSEGEVVMWAQKNAIDPYAPREVLSVAKLEERIKESAPRGKKKEAIAVLEPFVERISSGTALVAVTDARPPVKQIAAQDFPALT